jgi:hypothetical protein
MSELSREVGILTMTRIIEWAKGHIPSGKLRYALYCGLIDEFEKLGFYNLEECSDLDSQFMEAWEDMHEWTDGPENGSGSAQSAE